VNGTTTLTTGGGVAPLTTSWSRVTGSRIGQSGTSPSTFSASLGWGENVSEVFRATVTDALSRSATTDVTVNFSTPAAPACSISPTPLTAVRSGPGAVGGVATVSASGGTGGYTYAWSRLSGSVIGVANATSATASFSASLPGGGSAIESFRATVTDSAGNSVACDLTVNFSATAGMVVTITPSPVLGQKPYPGSNVDVTATANVTVSGGSGSYASFVWTKLTSNLIQWSGGQAVTFSLRIGAANSSFTDTFRVTVTDTLGGTSTADVVVTLRTTIDSGCGPNPCD
jgi:hypothetical protein